MGAEDDRLVGLFVAANFADDTLLLDGSANLVGQVKTDANFVGVGCDRPRQPHGVFARQNGLGNLVDISMDSVDSAIEQLVFPGSHPKNRGGTLFDSARDDWQRLGPLISEICVSRD